MPCTPYNPKVGLFINVLNWDVVQHSGGWTFQFARSQGSFDVYQLWQGGVLRDELFLPAGGAVRWIFFQSSAFLAVRHAMTSTGGSVRYRIFIYDLRSGVRRNELDKGPYVASSVSTQLKFHPSQDGTAFFIFFEEFAQPGSSTHTHQVVRTDNMQLLCSSGLATTSSFSQRLAEITGSRDVRILASPGPDGPRILNTCRLPSGELDVQPASQTFPEVVIGGPPSLASTTRQFTLQNKGDDCLSVDAITGIAPFSVSATSKPLPTTLNPSDTVTVQITFAPTTTGTFGPTDLPVAHTPLEGDSVLSCRGNARQATTRIGFSTSLVDFGSLPTGTASSPKMLKVRNDGETPLNVSLAGSPVGSPFQWSAWTGTIPFRGSKDIAITFTPAAQGPVTTTLLIMSNDPASPHSIALKGEGWFSTEGKVTFLRVHDVGTGWGPSTEHLDVEVVVKVDSEPDKALGFQLRTDANETAHSQILNLLRSAFNADRRVRIDYVRVGMRSGRIMQVTNVL